MAKKWYKRIPSMHETTAEHMATCWNYWCRERLRISQLQAQLEQAQLERWQFRRTAKTPPQVIGMRRRRKLAERCWFCGEFMESNPLSLRRKSIDHLHPRSRGGGNSESNIVIACQWCNGDKGAQTLSEYRQSSAQRLGIPSEHLTFWGERHPQ